MKKYTKILSRRSLPVKIPFNWIWILLLIHHIMESPLWIWITSYIILFFVIVYKFIKWANLKEYTIDELIIEAKKTKDINDIDVLNEGI